MQLCTPVDIPEAQHKITHDSCVMMLGSCFSQTMAQRLDTRLFDVACNPIGTLYNPLSIKECISHLAKRQTVGEDDLVEYNGMYHSYLCHSSMSRCSRGETLSAVNDAIIRGADRLATASHIFITLGTAIVYRLAATGQVVANCHKMPASRFRREMLSVDEAAQALESALQTISRINPSAEVWFTVSPIRHLSDGAHTNTLSKATLHLAVERLKATHREVGYFPAFEIVCDQLRDYRFYATDMAHPSDLAADIVFEQFAACFFSDTTIAAAHDCERWTKRLHHRQLTANREAFEAFRRSTLSAAQSLIQKYPSVRKAVERLIYTHSFTP